MAHNYILGSTALEKKIPGVVSPEELQYLEGGYRRSLKVGEQPGMSSIAEVRKAWRTGCGQLGGMLEQR